MIVPFYGEFLLHPIPLELSFGACSHRCAYCFVDANHPNGRPLAKDINKIMRLLADYPNRETLTAKLLKAGYPVTISNRVDPFCGALHKDFLPIIQTMTELGIPIYFQTKGGFGIDKVLEYLPPSVWYVTVESLNDDVTRKISVGAPVLLSELL